MRRNIGFTLIELLVVIAIVGLLAAIIFVSLREAKNKAMDAVEKQNVRQVQKGLEAYYLDEGNGYYPWAKDKEPEGWSFEDDWESWQDTPCHSSCTGPKDWCTDHSTSGPGEFMDQLVQTGYFSRDKINHMIGVDTGQTTILEMRYYYTCDLQEYRLWIQLSDGTTLTISN